MKVLLIAGLLMIALGVVLLVVPIPHTETHGIQSGDFSIGVKTHDSERVPPIISALLIAGGVALSIAGGRKGSS